MIPKNTLVRRNVAKHIKKEYDDFIKSPVKKIDVDEIQGNYHYRRRLNNNIKKRVTSLLTECTVEIDEMADLLQLLNDRALLDGFDIRDVLSKMSELNEKYGSYSDNYTTTDNVDIEDDGFIPYRVLGHKISGSTTAMVREKYREV